FDRFLGYQADDLASHHGHSVARGLAQHGLKHNVHRGLLEIRQVDRNLREIPRRQHDPKRLHVGKTAIRKTDGSGDLPGDIEVWCPQIDVVGHQEFPRTRRGSACGGMDYRFADVRLPFRRYTDLFDERLDLAAPNIFEV